MKRTLILAALLLPTLILGAWVAMLSYTHHTATIYTVTITGFDPRDLLHGRHIIFRYDWDSAQPPMPEGNYPDTGRYYIPESHADTLDAIFRQNAHDFSVTLQLQNTHPQIRALLIDNTPWKTWLSNQPAINGAPD